MNKLTLTNELKIKYSDILNFEVKEIEYRSRESFNILFDVKVTCRSTEAFSETETTKQIKECKNVQLKGCFSTWDRYTTEDVTFTLIDRDTVAKYGYSGKKKEFAKLSIQEKNKQIYRLSEFKQFIDNFLLFSTKQHTTYFEKYLNDGVSSLLYRYIQRENFHSEMNLTLKNKTKYSALFDRIGLAEKLACHIESIKEELIADYKEKLVDIFTGFEYTHQALAEDTMRITNKVKKPIVPVSLLEQESVNYYKLAEFVLEFRKRMLAQEADLKQLLKVS